MTLRPPSPRLRPLDAPGIRLQKRKLISTGPSIDGAHQYALAAHHFAQRRVVVRLDPDKDVRTVLLLPDATQTHAVPASGVTPAYRERFYAERSRQRAEIERWRHDKQRRMNPYAEDKRAAATGERQRGLPHADPAFESLLDALKPKAELGWPFDAPTPPPPRKRPRSPSSDIANPKGT